MLLNVGDKAPEFKLLDKDSNEVSLKDFAGKKVIIYFYPKDNTPGCTKEACSFKDYYNEIRDKNAVIIGISKDSAKSHTNFIDKYELPFILLTDVDNEVGKLYGTYGEKTMCGKTSMGTIRSTYVIDEEGKIEKVFDKVKTGSHGKDVLDYLLG